MKIKKLLLGIIIGSLVLPTISVSADSTYVNVDKDSKYTIENKKKDDTLYETYVKEATVSENNLKTFYYVAFTNGTMPEIPVDSDGYCVANDNGSEVNNWVVVLEDGNVVLSDWYVVKGYQQAYVLKKSEIPGKTAKYECTYTEKPVFVTKPEVSELGTRYHTFLFGKESSSERFELSSFAHVPRFYVKEKHLVDDVKRYVQIDKITDKDLIYELTRNKEGSLEKLMTYAKNNKNATEYSFEPGYTANYDNEIEVENGEYYYIYTFYKDEKVREDLNDIVFTQAKDYQIVKYEDYIEEDTDTSSTKPNKNEKTDNPKTGVEDYIIPTMLFISFLVLVSLLAKRKDLFKNI